MLLCLLSVGLSADVRHGRKGERKEASVSEAWTTRPVSSPSHTKRAHLQDQGMGSAVDSFYHLLHTMLENFKHEVLLLCQVRTCIGHGKNHAMAELTFISSLLDGVLFSSYQPASSRCWTKIPDAFLSNSCVRRFNALKLLKALKSHVDSCGRNIAQKFSFHLT